MSAGPRPCLCRKSRMAGRAALATTAGIEREKTTFNPFSTIFQPIMSRVSGQVTDEEDSTEILLAHLAFKESPAMSTAPQPSANSELAMKLLLDRSPRI